MDPLIITNDAPKRIETPTPPTPRRAPDEMMLPTTSLISLSPCKSEREIRRPKKEFERIDSKDSNAKGTDRMSVKKLVKHIGTNLPHPALLMPPPFANETTITETVNGTNHKA